MIYIVEDDEIMASCLAAACGPAAQCRVFHNALEVVQNISADAPELIFLDVLLTGPDGFTLLNELVSYEDTAKIPVVIVSSLDLTGKDLSAYGVVGVLNKDTMRPSDIRAYVQKYLEKGQNEQ